MLGNSNNNNQGRAKSPNSGEYFVADTGRYYRYPIIKTTTKRMEKLLLTLLNYVGWPTFILGVLANMRVLILDSWKATTLFIIAALFGLAKLFFFCVKQWQLYLYRRRQLKDDK